MSPKKGKPSRAGAHARCDCGHEKLVHGTGLAMYGSSDLECAIAGCQCKLFYEFKEPQEPRATTPKTLDRTEPKIFPPRFAS